MHKRIFLCQNRVNQTQVGVERIFAELHRNIDSHVFAFDQLKTKSGQARVRCFVSTPKSQQTRRRVAHRTTTN